MHVMIKCWLCAINRLSIFDGSCYNIVTERQGDNAMSESTAIVVAHSGQIGHRVKGYISAKYPMLVLRQVFDIEGINHVTSQYESVLLLISPNMITELHAAYPDGIISCRGKWRTVILCEDDLIQRMHNYNLIPFDDILFESAGIFDELDGLIERYCETPGITNHDAYDERHAGCARALFVRNIIYDYGYWEPLEVVNRKFCLNLHEGGYGAILVHPSTEEITPHFEFLELLHERFMRVSERLLSGLCYDILWHYRFSGFLAYINFPKENEEQIKHRCNIMHAILSQMMAAYSKYTFTISISKVYDSWQDFAKAKEEVYNTSYSRLDEGDNRVIYADDVQMSWNEEKQDWLEKHRKKISEACTKLDYKAFEYHLRGLLAFLRNTKSQAKLLVILQDINKEFFEMHKDMLSEEVDCDAARNLISWVINRSKDTYAMTQAVLAQIEPFFEMALNTSERASKKPIKFAITYIYENIEKQILLTDVAEKLYLSPGYLAQLFKRETGKCFTEYVADCKLSQAKEMLKLTNLSIQEISLRIGFGDQRYFSRWFKIHVGITPTEYKKRYRQTK